MRMPDSDLIGFIGVGVMGRPMAQRLLDRGYRLLVRDTNPAAAAELAAHGALVASSVREVADRAAIVFTSLPTPAIFREVALGADGLAQGRAIRIMVDLSTVGSRLEQEVAAGLLAHGIDTVDAPVSGGAIGAENGTLTVIVAGKPEAVAQVRALFDVFGNVTVVGQAAGQAQFLKLLNNMLSSTAFAITSEAFVAGARAGLDPEVMISVINASSGRNGSTQDKFPRQVLTGSFDYGFPIGSVCKDIGLAVDECQALGVPMRVGDAVRQVWNEAAAQDGAQRDMTELVRYIEDWSGPKAEE
jgi:2-hydroxy-3-oxopropionate reductase